MSPQLLLLSLVVLISKSEQRPFHFGFKGVYPLFGPPIQPFNENFVFKFPIFPPSFFNSPYSYQPNPGWLPNFAPDFHNQPHKNPMFSKKLDFIIPNDQNPQFRTADSEGDHIETMSMEELDSTPGKMMIYKAKDKDTDADITVYKYKSDDSDPNGIDETAYIAKKGPINMSGFRVFRSGSNEVMNESEYITANLDNHSGPLALEEAGDMIDAESNNASESDDDESNNIESNSVSPPKEDSDAASEE